VLGEEAAHLADGARDGEAVSGAGGRPEFGGGGIDGLGALGTAADERLGDDAEPGFDGALTVEQDGGVEDGAAPIEAEGRRIGPAAAEIDAAGGGDAHRAARPGAGERGAGGRLHAEADGFGDQFKRPRAGGGGGRGVDARIEEAGLEESAGGGGPLGGGLSAQGDAGELVADGAQGVGAGGLIEHGADIGAVLREGDGGGGPAGLAAADAGGEGLGLIDAERGGFERDARGGEPAGKVVGPITAEQPAGGGPGLGGLAEGEEAGGAEGVIGGVPELVERQAELGGALLDGAGKPEGAGGVVGDGTDEDGVRRGGARAADGHLVDVGIFGDLDLVLQAVQAAGDRAALQAQAGGQQALQGGGAGAERGGAEDGIDDAGARAGGAGDVMEGALRDRRGERDAAQDAGQVVQRGGVRGAGRPLRGEQAGELGVEIERRRVAPIDAGGDGAQRRGDGRGEEEQAGVDGGQLLASGPRGEAASGAQGVEGGLLQVAVDARFGAEDVGAVLGGEGRGDGQRDAMDAFGGEGRGRVKVQQHIAAGDEDTGGQRGEPGGGLGQQVVEDGAVGGQWREEAAGEGVLGQAAAGAAGVEHQHPRIAGRAGGQGAQRGAAAADADLRRIRHDNHAQRGRAEARLLAAMDFGAKRLSLLLTAGGEDDQIPSDAHDAGIRVRD